MYGAEDETAHPSYYWLIASRENGQINVRTARPTGTEELLPVFDFAEEAESFLRSEAFEGGWRIRQTTTGELVSILYGPCAGVDGVVLGPSPKRFGVKPDDTARTMGRDDFVRLLTVGGDAGLL